MKIHYDAEVDALYIEFRFLEDGAAVTKRIADDVNADYAPDGKLAGLEILDARELLGSIEGKLVVEIAPSTYLPKTR